MNLTDLQSLQAPIEVYEGIYMRRLPMTQMQALLSAFKGKTSDEEAKKATNNLLKKILVDEDGEQFDDLKTKNPTDILSIDVVQAITQAITSKITPGDSEKK